VVARSNRAERATSTAIAVPRIGYRAPMTSIVLPAEGTTPLNAQFLPGNTCFGCGSSNPEGLRIEIFRDGDRSDRLVGRYRPRETAVGFPWIVHGGLQFTALDCMAGWVMLMLRAPPRSMPITKMASMRFMRPARIGTGLLLSATVVREAATPRDPILIRAEIRDADGELLSEADFDYVALPVDRFMKAVAIDALPEGYGRHFGDV
jgi:acyl-coenzyme A thioesterase PaaI-like protein